MNGPNMICWKIPTQTYRNIGTWITIFFCLAWLGPAVAQRTESVPQELEGVGVTEHLGTQIPLDLKFTDSNGKQVELGKFFDGTRPVLLTMNYSDCPRLCIIQLNAMVEALKLMPWNVGEQFQIVTVSIDPLESSERAQLTKQKYLKLYGRPGTADGWHFLVGREENIKKVAETIGFHYKFIDKQYVHVAMLMICTPEGRISRYLGGVEYDPQTLRLSLTEAAEGKMGSTMDLLLLYCFHYDASKGRYSLAAYNLMRVGGVFTMVVLGGLLLHYWRHERRKPAAEEPQPQA